MATYLLTYNPKKGNFRDYDEGVMLTSNRQTYLDNWRVKSGKIAIEDRVFVLRQGQQHPTGIIAEGIVTKGSYHSTIHRDGTGKFSFRVDIELRSVRGPDEPLVRWPLPERSHNGKFKGPFSSGVLISEEIAKEIERAWLQSAPAKRFGFDLSAALMEEPMHSMPEIKQRQGQSEFRADLFHAYDNHCGLSDCDAGAALEAAHIVSYSGPASNHVQNGILLRADLHTLFDLNLFMIDPEALTVKIDASLQGTSYSWLSGKRLNEPKKLELRPSVEALRYRANECGSSL